MKALLKYKIRSVTAVLIFGGLVILAAVVLLFFGNGKINPYEIQFGTFFMERLSVNLRVIPILLIPVAVSLGIILTKEYGDREKEDFLSGLPIKSSHRFMACILLGVVFFVAFGIILCTAVIINYEMTYNYYNEINMMSANYEIITKMDGVGNGILHVVQITLTMMMLYFIAVFAGTIARNKLVTVLVLAEICVFPMYIPEAINKIMTEYFHIEMPLYNEIINYTSLGTMMEEGTFLRIGNTDYTYFEYIVEKTVAAGCLTLVFAVLSYCIAVKSHRLHGKIMVNKAADTVFIVFSGIYGAFMIPLFRNADNMKFGIMAVLMAVVFAVIEFVLYKFITGKGRYSYLNAGGKRL